MPKMALTHFETAILFALFTSVTLESPPRRPIRSGSGTARNASATLSPRYLVLAG